MRAFPYILSLIYCVDGTAPLLDFFTRDTPTHLSSRRCDPLASREYNYLSITPDEVLPLKLETTSVTGKQTSDETSSTNALRYQGEVPTSNRRRTALSPQLLAFIYDREVPSNTSIVKVTYFQHSVTNLYLNREEFSIITLPTPLDSFFYFSPDKQYEAYKDYGRDRMTVSVTDSSVYPRHLATDGDHVTFADIAEESKSKYAQGKSFVWDIFLYSRVAKTRWKRVFLPHQEADDTCPHKSGANVDGDVATHRLYPSLCKGRLMYIMVKVNITTDSVLESAVITFDIDDGATFAHQANDKLFYGLTSWTVSAHENSCAFAWVEVSKSSVSLRLHHTPVGDPSEKDVPYLSVDLNSSLSLLNSTDTNQTSLFGTEVFVETFPSLSTRRLIIQRDDITQPLSTFWQNKGTDLLPFTELVENLEGGGELLFVKRVDLPKVTAYRINKLQNYAYYYDTPRNAVSPSYSNDPELSQTVVDFTAEYGDLDQPWNVDIKLHDALDNALLFHMYFRNVSINSGDKSAFFMARMPVAQALDSEIPPEVEKYICIFDEPYDHSWTSSYYDTLIVKPSADDHLYRLDLDKDNDQLFDKQDRFPLSSLDTWDKDNDGISDEGDIVDIRKHSSCEEYILISVNDCINDLVVMYTAWGVFTIFIIAATLLIAKARENLIKEGRLVESQLTEEDISVVSDGVEALGATSTPNWLDEMQQLIDIRDRVNRYHILEVTMQYFLLLLTIVSVILVVIPLWNKTRLSQRTLEIFTWMDLFTASVFATDLITRWFFRENTSQTFCEFVKENWFDFPSLVCDIPGVTTSGSLDVLVVARFFRVLRILKIFRVMRLYRKVTNQSAYVALVVNYSHWLLPIIAILLLITVAVVLKIVEQYDQSDFESYWNCLWFCLVTATTVGYGDMTPIHWVGRLLACVLMVCGIGMIGNITARVSERISQTGYQRAQEKERQERHEDHPAIRLALLELSVAFNPLVALKDKRKEHVDFLSIQFMSPRYRDVAIMHQNKKIHEEFQEAGDNDLDVTHPLRPVTPISAQSGRYTPGLSIPLESLDHTNTDGSNSSILSNTGIAEIRTLWKGKGHYGRTVKNAFIRATTQSSKSLPSHALKSQYIPPSELAARLRSDADIRRLRRALSVVEQNALDEVIALLEQPSYQSKVIVWEVFEQELIQTQEYFYALAQDMLLKRKQLEWSWNRYNDYNTVQKLRKFRSQRDDPLPKCRDKLYLLLLRYKLDESYKGVRDWEKLFVRLNSCISRKPRKNQLIIEKLFSVGCFEHGVGEEEDNPIEQEATYDWQDPIEDIFLESETILRQHNVHTVEGFNEILFAIESIAMQFDRLECTRWALHHLDWCSSDGVVLIPRPPLVSERGRPNVVNPLLHVPRPVRCPYEDVAGACKQLLIYKNYDPTLEHSHEKKPNGVRKRNGRSDADTHDSDDDETEGFSPLMLGESDYEFPFCMGERCATSQKISGILPDSILSNKNGYFACPEGHYFLCLDCAKMVRDLDDDEVALSRTGRSFGSRSSCSVLRRPSCPFDLAEEVDLEEVFKEPTTVSSPRPPTRRFTDQRKRSVELPEFTLRLPDEYVDSKLHPKAGLTEDTDDRNRKEMIILEEPIAESEGGSSPSGPSSLEE